MSQNPLIRLGVYGAGILFIFIVLFVSVTRQTLYAPTPQDIQARAKLTVSDRFRELETWPPNPDHPLYIFRVGLDQLHLRTVSAEELPLLKMELAEERLKSAHILLSHHRTSLSLTTITKSSKYILSAASDVVRMYPNVSTSLHGKVRTSVNTQIEEITAMKESFSDEQKAVVDRLLSELELVRAQFL